MGTPGASARTVTVRFAVEGTTACSKSDSGAFLFTDLELCSLGPAPAGTAALADTVLICNTHRSAALAPSPACKAVSTLRPCTATAGERRGVITHAVHGMIAALVTLLAGHKHKAPLEAHVLTALPSTVPCWLHIQWRTWPWAFIMQVRQPTMQCLFAGMHNAALVHQSAP